LGNFSLYEEINAMGQKDISEKTLLEFNDVFSDVINGIIFKGEQKVLPEMLENMTVHSQYKTDNSKLHEQERDVAKYWKNKQTTLAIYGFEDESIPEKHMPVRLFSYDGAAYRSQLGAKQISPVITLVLYFGTKQRWNAPRNLKDLIEIPEGLGDYVNDYHANIVEVAWLTEEEINRFKSDFRIVANFFRNKRINEDYIPDDPTVIKHVDEVLKLLAVMTGDDQYNVEIKNVENGGVSMCTVAQNLRHQGANELADILVKLMEENRQEEAIQIIKDKNFRDEWLNKLEDNDLHNN
jgi:hypothetical protein